MEHFHHNMKLQQLKAIFRIFFFSKQKATLKFQFYPIAPLPLIPSSADAQKWYLCISNLFSEEFSKNKILTVKFLIFWFIRSQYFRHLVLRLGTLRHSSSCCFSLFFLPESNDSQNYICIRRLATTKISKIAEFLYLKNVNVITVESDGKIWILGIWCMLWRRQLWLSGLGAGFKLVFWPLPGVVWW